MAGLMGSEKELNLHIYCHVLSPVTSHVLTPWNSIQALSNPEQYPLIARPDLFSKTP